MIDFLRIGCVIMILSSVGCTDLHPSTSNKVRVYNKVVNCDDGFSAAIITVDGPKVVIDCTRIDPANVENKTEQLRLRAGVK